MQDLYDIVSHYAGLGDHRTGTRVDRNTVDWLAGLLSGAGAEVERHPYSFSMFQGSAEGQGSAKGLRLEPLYYSAAGRHAEQAAYVTAIDFDEDHSDTAINLALDTIRRKALQAGASLAIAATLSETGGLCAINRAPAAPGDLPVCLAAGRDLKTLQTGRAGAAFHAGLSVGRSENLTGYYPCAGSPVPPLVVTTPQSGWFACAGERGTGLAIALSVARELSERVPVLLVIPTGHELGYLGAADFVEGFGQPVSGVLHLGSCVGDQGSVGVSGGQRLVTNLEGRGAERVTAALTGLSIVPERPARPLDPAEWIGESELWAPRGLPMISLAGTSPHFHTPQDLAHTATTPELMRKVRSCVLKAAGALLA